LLFGTRDVHLGRRRLKSVVAAAYWPFELGSVAAAASLTMAPAYQRSLSF